MAGPQLITLTEDGPLGKTGDRVWVNDGEKPDKKPTPKNAGKNK